MNLDVELATASSPKKLFKLNPEIPCGPLTEIPRKFSVLTHSLVLIIQGNPVPVCQVVILQRENGCVNAGKEKGHSRRSSEEHKT